MVAKRGLFIVLYGPDGIGKSKQCKLLEEKLRSQRRMVRYLRYPVYEQVPSGKRLDELLHVRREKLPEIEMQRLFAQNRREFEPTLRSWLEAGTTVVCENYSGTGLVWGTLAGVELGLMEEINQGLLKPDLEIFLDGPRRGKIDDDGHPYGVGFDDEEWYRVRNRYWELADKYGWVRVSADAPMLTTANRVWAVVRPLVELG